METLIRKAFSAARKPKQDEITLCGCDECKSLRDFFADFRPEDATIDDLRQHETILIHGTSVAFRYYLQFFLRFSIENIREAGAIPDLIVFAISSDYKSLDRTSSLVKSEIDCINLFVTMLVNTQDCGKDEAAAVRKTLSRVLARRNNGGTSP